jgi:hypothetical protein
MSNFSNAPLAQGTTTPVTLGQQGIATPKMWVPQIGNLAAEIAAAYAGADYGAAKMIAAIRGGHNIPLLKVETFKEAAYMAACGYPGYELNQDGSVSTKKGKGKTLSNEFSMAATAAAYCLPELGESLRQWYNRTTKPEVPQTGNLETKVPQVGNLNQLEPTETVETIAAHAAHVAANAIEPSKIAPIKHAAPLVHLPATGAKNDDIKDFLDLADSTLNDADLQAVIDGLIAIRNHRNAIKLAA